MKNIYTLLAIMIFGLTPTLSNAAAKAGPNKGLIMEIPEKNAEFFVDAERKINIALYDTAMKKIAPENEVVTAIAEAPSGKEKIEFEKKGETLVSKTAIPEGEGYQIVIQIKTTPDAKAKNFRVKYEPHGLFLIFELAYIQNII